MTATTTGNCSFVGTVGPRASAKNVYDVSLAFGAAPCGDPGATITGVAFIDAPSATTQELVVMLLNASGSVGRTFIGSR